MPRRDFDLPPDDVAFLDLHHPGWEAYRDGTTNWLLVSQCMCGDGKQLATCQRYTTFY